MSPAQTYDLVVIGSGAGSVCAALAAKRLGAKPLIIEKTPKFGGSTALSGGVIWLPNNPVMKRAGVQDSEEAGRLYLDACTAGAGIESTPARRAAYLREGPHAISFLEEHGMKFAHCEGWSDYHEGQLPGAVSRGRSMEAQPFDLRALGPWQDKFRRHEGAWRVPITVPELTYAGLNGRTAASKMTLLRVGWRILRNRLGRDIGGMGAALQGRLLKIALDEKIEIWLDASLKDLSVADAKVTGVVIERAGREQRVAVTRGVLLDAGGFSHNAEMRRRYQRPGTTTEWSAASPGDTGEVQQIAMNHGADVALMEESWWIPVSRPPGGDLLFNNPLDLSKPHTIMVDRSGRRFVNEATSYVAVGLAMYERSKTVPANPSWAIIESRHRNRYRWGGQSPGEPPPEWIKSGYMRRAATLSDLAQQCGIEPATLIDSVDRFNRFARDGKDEDFGRGDSAYDRYYGDSTARPNAALGTIETGPFYAVQIHAGDTGTSGGLVTDEHARVLRVDGKPIVGLYATGNTSAPVMSRSYPGGGASIGAALVFGYIGARHACGSKF